MNSWISQDICFCINNKCPIKEYCFRAIGCKSKIATYSYLEKVCNHSNVFQNFIQAPMELVYEKRNTRKEVQEC